MLAPPLSSTVSAVMSLGFTARETIPIVFCGFLLCSGALTLTGKMGARYNVAFPVLVRSIFGMYGSYPVIVLRSFVAAMWTAILCVGHLSNIPRGNDVMLTVDRRSKPVTS
jgi:cytosine/uracil/thiamine/allantoin permease